MRSVIIGQKLVENAKINKINEFKCDILSNFRLLCEDILTFSKRSILAISLVRFTKEAKPIRWAFTFAEELAKWICPYWGCMLRIRKRIQITLQATLG